MEAVVEGVGDHGCEYMTGGRVVYTWAHRTQFCSGMSGGLAYVFDEKNELPANCNKEMVNLQKLTDPAEVEHVKGMLQRHMDATQSRLLNAYLRTG